MGDKFFVGFFLEKMGRVFRDRERWRYSSVYIQCSCYWRLITGEEREKEFFGLEGERSTHRGSGPGSSEAVRNRALLGPGTQREHYGTGTG